MLRSISYHLYYWTLTEVPKKEKKKYIPPMDHPWRKASFANYAAKQAPLWCFCLIIFEILSISVDRFFYLVKFIGKVNKLRQNLTN